MHVAYRGKNPITRMHTQGLFLVELQARDAKALKILMLGLMHPY
jgi:hypothetical protein